jgi:hydrogenase maturation protease
MTLLVVGFGNALQADDGAGPAVIARLRSLSLPAGTRAEHGGTDAMRLASLWDGEGQVWLVDAMRTGARPGSIHRLDPRQIQDASARAASAHELSLPECLGWLRCAFPAMGGIDWSIWGIEPACLGCREGLSAPVAWAVDRVAAEIRERVIELHQRRRAG